MSGFEDLIGQVMAAHDDEAPSSDDLLRAIERAPARYRSQWRGQRRPGQSWLVPLAAAAAVAVIAAGSLWAGGALSGQRPASTLSSRPEPRSLLHCPAKYAGNAPWVPAMPAGIDGRSRLVPERTPRSAVICAYPGNNFEKRQVGWALAGRRVLSGGLAALADQLSWQPRLASGQLIACTQMGGAQTNYLVGLTYRARTTLWVAATQDPNYCVGSSNGEFASFGVVGPVVSEAFASGRWPAMKAISCHGQGPGFGRLGQDKAMVPPGATSVTICARGGITFTSGYQNLISALNALPTHLSTRQCSSLPGRRNRHFYDLLFSYPSGPAVEVSVNLGCVPAVDNLSLQAQSASTIAPIITQLLNPRTQR